MTKTLKYELHIEMKKEAIVLVSEDDHVSLIRRKKFFDHIVRASIASKRSSQRINQNVEETFNVAMQGG